MTGPDLNVLDALGHKPAVDIAELPVNEAPKNLTVPPASIQILEFEAK